MWCSRPFVAGEPGCRRQASVSWVLFEGAFVGSVTTRWPLRGREKQLPLAISISRVAFFALYLLAAFHLRAIAVQAVLCLARQLAVYHGLEARAWLQGGAPSTASMVPQLPQQERGEAEAAFES